MLEFSLALADPCLSKIVEYVLVFHEFGLRLNPKKYESKTFDSNFSTCTFKFVYR